MGKPPAAALIHGLRTDTQTRVYFVPDVPPDNQPAAAESAMDALLAAIRAEFAVAFGSADRVREACAKLRAAVGRSPSADASPGADVSSRPDVSLGADQPAGSDLPLRLADLPPLLWKRAGPVAAALFDFLEDFARTAADPRPIVEGLFAARDAKLAERALDLAGDLAARGTLAVDQRLAETLADLVESATLGAAPLMLTKGLAVKSLNTAECGGAACGLRMSKIRAILTRLAAPPAAGTDDPIRALYLTGATPRLRRLAARLLDLDGQPASPETARRVLGEEAGGFLAPYLAYTRATHLDLLDLVPAPGAAAPALAALRLAEGSGVEPKLLREVIGQVGWPRLNLGLHVRRLVGLCIADSPPLFVTPAEAGLFETPPARQVVERFLFVAHGGTFAEAPAAAAGGDAVARFRAYNIAHAEALADILDVAPLTREKVRRILDRMGRIVADFAALFAAYSEECAALPILYEQIKTRVEIELGRAAGGEPLSAELTRLVQMFEDPRTPAEVRTLHGLKRYLHQKGLRLGFRLVETGRATNRTVDLVLASTERVLHVVRGIEYVDFEPDRVESRKPGRQTLPFGSRLNEDELDEQFATGHSSFAARHSSFAIGHSLFVTIPYPVLLLVDGLSRQLLVGHDKFPSVRIFCYGNEVHYYAAFGNHPAFIRIDYSPPLRGGMIDVEYFGVSKFELEHHPAPALDGIRHFFRALEFDCQIDSTRIHARYDKERALGLDDLCDKAAALFCLVPYLMEVDWVIGSLDLNEAARGLVAPAWAEFFIRWGALPISQLLTGDRRGIVQAVEQDAAGRREVAWNGTPPYRDRLRTRLPPNFLPGLCRRLRELGLPFDPRLEGLANDAFGQIAAEELLLCPWREALARGEIVETDAGLHPCPPGRFQPLHEAQRFAGLLAGEDDALADAARVAALVAPLERGLRFQTTGSLSGYAVQRARLALRGQALSLYVLRDAADIVRLAFYARGEALFRRRADESAPWFDNAGLDAVALAAVLRGNNYLAESAPPPDPITLDPAYLHGLLSRPNPAPPAGPAPGDRLLAGLRAAPGRAVGPALLETAGRRPADFAGAVLVAPAIRADDDICLYHAAAVVSTGGGILSHAGLLAVQFHKPALIVAGTWGATPDGKRYLTYRPVEYDETEEHLHGRCVRLRRNFREREERLGEGDLLVVDADEGVLRILGQNRDALALHYELTQLRDVRRQSEQTAGEQEILALRGRRLRALHQLEKLLQRLGDAMLARHAAHELLLGEGLAADAAGRDERARLLRTLMANAAVGAAARDYVRDLAGKLAERHAAAHADAVRLVPITDRPYDILTLRWRVLSLHAALRSMSASLPGSTEALAGALPLLTPLELLTLHRLNELRSALVCRLRENSPDLGLHRSRHLLRQLDRISELLSTATGGESQPAPDDERGMNAAAQENAAAPAAHARHDDGEPAPLSIAPTIAAIRGRLVDWARGEYERCADRRILHPQETSLAVQPLVGSKAANLAELTRLLGPGLVPPWFVVTDRAFREVLELPVAEAPDLAPAEGATLADGVTPPTLGSRIQGALAHADWTPAQKAGAIAALWSAVRLPPDLSTELVAAYRGLFDAGAAEGQSVVREYAAAKAAGAAAGGVRNLAISDSKSQIANLKSQSSILTTEISNPHSALDAPHSFVAVRSSGCEEDTEAATRAGEFDTFLFVHGDDALLDNLKRAWAGLWTERAIHNRAAFGLPALGAGGGVLVQRMVFARVSGVLQTVNVAENKPGEMVVNAGLGLGEGIVSGTVAADQLIVAKEDDLERGPLHFRYHTADKRERVVFDAQRGHGTVREETLYHQRQRPALEYVEICELVRAAAQLEAAYGYPLDIEFAIEGTRLWLLQVRPLPTFAAVLRETMERYPLGKDEM